MPGSTYGLFAWTAQNHVRLFCRHEGLEREICVIIVGHTGGVEKALVWQVAGETSQGPLRMPGWRCLTLSKVSDAEPCAGNWVSGARHDTRQTCVSEVDYDANEASPYDPKQSLGDLRREPLEAAMHPHRPAG